MREQAGAGAAFLDREVGGGCLQDGLAGPAGVAWPDMADDLEPGRDLLQHFGDVLAELGQALRVGAAAAAGEYRLVQDGLARQMIGQRLAQRWTARLVGLALRLGFGVRRGCGLRLVLLEVANQHLELTDLGGELLGRFAKPIPPQRSKLDLQLLDLEARVLECGLTLGQRRVTLGQYRIAFRQQRAERGNLGVGRGERRGVHVPILRDAISVAIPNRLYGRLWSCSPGRHSPIDALEQHRELRRGQRDHPGRRLRPYKAAFLQPLGD